MSVSSFIALPPVSWREPVSTVSALPTTGNQSGDAIITKDTDIIYIWNGSAWVAATSGGAPGTVTSVGLADGSTTPIYSISGSPVTTSGTLTETLVNQTANTVFAGPSTNGPAQPIFRSLVSADIPTSVALTGVPTAPTAGVGTSTTQLATTAFVQSQGFIGSSSSVPTGEQDNASAQTSATTAFVTCLTTTVTLTTTAPILAVANATLTTTSSASVAGYRITINSVASRTALQTLSATATNYLASIHFISASLSPGTYTVTFDIQRSSGTGTVNYASGTLIAEGLQGAASNGITQLTGALQAGPGSGSQALTGVLPIANGGTNNSATPSAGQLLRATSGTVSAFTTLTFPTTSTINQLLYSSAANTVTGLATANTGALVTSSTGVPSITSGTTANRLLRTNGTTVSFAQAALATDVSGTLPAANGGTGHGNWANQQIPFGNGTSLVGDPNLIYDSTNGHFVVGGSGTFRINAIVASGSTGALQAYSEGTNNCFQIRNNNAYALVAYTANDTPAAGGLVGFGRSRGTQTTRTQSKNGDTVLTFTGSGYTGSVDTGDTGGFNNSITFVQTEDATASANGGEMFFSTTPNTTRTPVERVRIKQSGETIFQQAISTANFTTTQKNALTPSPGWVIYDSTLNKLSYYNGTTWVNL